MSRPIKFFLLFLALLLPGMVYIFLRTFGRNEFEVPVLYKDGAVPLVAGCEGYTYTVPYLVPDSVLTRLGIEPAPVSLVVVDSKAVKAAVGRVEGEFATGEFQVVEVADAMRSLAVCALALQPPANAVLVDNEGRVRGQYDVADRDEADRLILELNIILKKY